MRIGITVGIGSRSDSTIEGLIERARDAEHRGFQSLWMANAFGFDAITALAVAGRDAPNVEIGTAVVPTYPRHPVVMAQQALTAQAALGGRFTLGIGLSHESMITGALGMPFERPARHMKEYLAVLAPLVRREPVSFQGEMYRVQAAVSAGDVAPVPIILAAMGPAMLKLAATRADGTITSWVGPRALEQHIVPTIRDAAGAAGRSDPRVIVGLPIALTNDPDAARAQIATQAAAYNSLPSYRSMLDIEGAEGPADVALLGDESALDDALARLNACGATDFAAQVVSVGSGTASRTVEFLASRVTRP